MTRRRKPPAWAHWSPAGAERPWTVGVEEEMLLLHDADASVANRIEDVLDAISPLTPATAETHACVVELATRPHETVAAVVDEAVEHRERLRDALAPLGLTAGIAGTHPCATWTEVGVAPVPRYRRIHASLRALARREPTCALHVHVAVPDGEAAVRALAGLREDLPVLLALAANSPFWQGRDTGLASARTPILSMFPRIGIPRAFGSYAAYVGTVDGLVRAGAIPDPSFLWWDVRLQPGLGTVEVRVMDAQTEPADVAAVTALVQCLVRGYASTGPGDEPPAAEALDENRFLATRDGLAATLITRRATEAAADTLERLLGACRPLARSLGCALELEGVRRLASDPGHARQRAAAQLGGPGAVALHLAERFAPLQERGAVAV